MSALEIKNTKKTLLPDSIPRFMHHFLQLNSHWNTRSFMPANPVDFAEVKRLWEANAWVILLIHPKKCPAVSFSSFFFCFSKITPFKGGNQLCLCSKRRKVCKSEERREKVTLEQSGETQGVTELQSGRP